MDIPARSFLEFICKFDGKWEITRLIQVRFGKRRLM